MAYKRRFSDDDVERMEQDADAAGRITAAERRMTLAGNSTNNRNNQIADIAAAAHERRMASRQRFIESNPNAVNPWERQSTLGYARQQNERQQLQEHERGMLGDKIKGEVDVAHEKRLGMENQGVGAAKINAAVTTEGNRSRFGFFDENGVYHPGSDVQSAEARGLADFEKNFLTNQTKLDIANSNNATKRDIATGNNDTKRDITSENNDTKRAIEEQKRLAEKERFEKNLKYKYERLDEQTRKNVDDAADKLIKNSDGKLSLEDARAQVMAGREQAQQQGGNITTDSTGAKWEIVKDANGKPIGKRRVQ